MTAPQKAIEAAGKRGVIQDEMTARQIYDDALARGWGFRGGLAQLFATAYEWGKLDAQRPTEAAQAAPDDAETNV